MSMEQKTAWSFDFLPDYTGQHTSKLKVMQRIYDLILRAYEEDVGPGDVTTNATVNRGVQAVGSFLAKADGCLSGLHIVRLVFEVIDPTLQVSFTVDGKTYQDGSSVTKGTIFGVVTGSAHALIQAERLALNIAQRMSGIATATHHMVTAVSDTECKILDTRKTVPGLRDLDKLAVRHGGGTNHRYGLHDMVMIKDNHVTACGGVIDAVRAAKAYLSAEPSRSHIQIEVETRTLEEVQQVVSEGGVLRIMLDNMVNVTRAPDGTIAAIDTTMLDAAMAIVRTANAAHRADPDNTPGGTAPDGDYETEASGNVLLDTVGVIARSGVTHISSGALTHSVVALDISLKIKLAL